VAARPAEDVRLFMMYRHPDSRGSRRGFFVLRMRSDDLAWPHGDTIRRGGGKTPRNPCSGSRRGACYATDNNDNRRRSPAPRDRRREGVTAEAAAVAAPAAKTERAARLGAVAGSVWSGALLALLAFLVLYPVAMLLLGALTNTNPVVDGFGVFDLS